MRAMTTIINTTPLNLPRQRGGCESRSPETRQKMSDRAQEHGFTPEERRVRMENAQALHAAKRAQRFKGVRIDPGVVDDYISIRKGRVTVDVDGCTASFIGKYESEEALKQKAREFLVNLAQATLPNCSGNP